MFSLNIDPVQVDRDFKTMEKTVTQQRFNPMVTRLEDLGIDEKQAIFEPDYTIDKKYFFVPLKEYITSKSLPSSTQIACLHCTESFNTPPLGIPVDFVPTYRRVQVVNERDGAITEYNHTLTEKELKILEDKGETDMIVYRNYFLVDGNFCSFPCMLSYIATYPNEYSNVKPLMHKLHKVLYNKPMTCMSAPSIRLLKKFGGHLGINEFRTSSSNHYYPSVSRKQTLFTNESRPLTPMVPYCKMYQYHGNKLS